MTTNRSRLPKVSATARRAFDLDGYLPYLINRTGVVVADAFSEELAPAGLTLPMWRILAAVFHGGEQRQIDLCRLTSIDESSLSRLISRLARKDLVARRRSPTSNREVSVTLTARGRTLTRRFIPIALAYEAVGTQGISRGDLRIVRRCLTQIFHNLEDWVAANGGRRGEVRRRARRP